MMSIRKKLIISILSTIFLVTLLLALITYLSLREEMDEFYDENMRQVAITVLSTAGSGEIKRPDHIPAGRKLRGEEKYLTQIWQNGVLKYSSYPTVEFPLQEQSGKGKTEFNGGTWSYYKETNGAISVQLSQDLKERHSIVFEIYGLVLIPIILQLPVLAVLIWFLIGYGLKPLYAISNLIKNRDPYFLEPLPGDRIPDEVNVLVDALNGLLARLGQALELQRRFTADAAHELRTPLTAVRLQLDILNRADNEEEKKAALITLEKGVQRSIHLVQQLLELARQEPENAEAQFSPMDLTYLIEESVDHIIPIARSKHITLTSHIDGKPIVYANESKLSLMLSNLLSNAVAYTKQGGHVEIRLRNEGDTVILDVADDGIGIKPKDRERVFDRFYRVIGNESSGAGLGLSIVKSVAQLHNADITVSEGLNGKGTCFSVHFRKMA